MRNLDLAGGTEVVTEAESWVLLETAEYGRLAVTTADKPDIFPVNFELVGRTIVLQTNIGHKFLAALRGEAWVAFEVDRVHEQAGIGWSVVVHGQARDVSDDPAFRPARTPWAGEKDYRVAIDVDTISGRRIRVS
jgi:nitroimidazol reductase NimA-like FMN-containing flavoprotein (pyridoxamine 5'-phosphate oxidase superfamily)